MALNLQHYDFANSQWVLFVPLSSRISTYSDMFIISQWLRALFPVAVYPCDMMIPCVNGKCVPSEDFPGKICECSDGYSGELCDVKVKGKCY